MGIVRAFSATCDTCNGMRDGVDHWVWHLKDDLRAEGWKVQNKLTCPACLGTNPEYWDWELANRDE